MAVEAAGVGPDGEARRARWSLAAEQGAGRELGQFEERFGVLRFTFEAELSAYGFRWRFVDCPFGPLPLPRALSPCIRARAFEADGAYRFSVTVAHPLVGLMFAYAGRLR